MSLVGGTLLTHGERWAATVDDLHTVRVIKRNLEDALRRHQIIADEIADPDLRAEFLALFAEDVARCDAVIATCAQRLQDTHK